MKLLSRLGVLVAAGALVAGTAQRQVSALPVPFDPSAQPGFIGLPDEEMDKTNGKFLVVVGEDNFSLPGTPGKRGRTVINLAFEKAPATALSRVRTGTPQILLPTQNLNIAIFDADTGGFWDQRADGQGVIEQPNATYELFLDPAGDGASRLTDPDESNNPDLAESHDAFEAGIVETDAQWLKVFDRPLDDEAFDADDGLYHYVLRVTLVPTPSSPPSTGQEVNGFKLAFNGQYTIPRQAIMGFAGGAIDFDSFLDVQLGTGVIIEGSRDPARGSPANKYDGVFEFPFDTRKFCSVGDLHLFDADADWNPPIVVLDETPVGLPPDDGGRYVDPRDPQSPDQKIIRDSSAYKVSPQILWEMLDPDGNVVFSSNVNSPPDSNGVRHVSSNAPSSGNPFQETVLPGAGFTQKPGIWRFRWRGVDMRNFVFFGFDAPVEQTGDPGKAVGVVFCDTDKDGIQDPGEVGIGGATVTVTALPDALFPPITTNADGTWEMGPLSPGDYSVTVSDVAFPPVTTASRDFTIDPPTCVPFVANVPIGFNCTKRTVCGHIYCDVNQNGVFDAEDEAHALVSVTCKRIVLPGGTVLTETGETDTFGEYCIELPDESGDWTAEVDPTQPALKGDTPAGPTTIPVGAGEPKDLDFVFLCPGSLSGTVFVQHVCTGIGKPVPEDTLLPGVTVTLDLLDDAGEVVPGTRQAAVTDDSGFYSFLELLPGTYRVQISTEPPQEVLAGLTPSGVEVIDAVVQVRAETPDNDFRYCAECVCPDQSTDCSSGYHLVELEIDVFQRCATRVSWANPTPWVVARPATKSWVRSAAAASVTPPAPVATPAPASHVVQVSVPYGSVRITFSGDEWHGDKKDRVLTVTDVWKVADGHWKVALKIWACDVDGHRGCLAKALHCVRAVVDCNSRMACIDLSGKVCLALGAAADACGNPWYTIRRWVSCDDSKCCPPNPCCAGCGCPPKPCGCTR